MQANIVKAKILENDLRAQGHVDQLGRLARPNTYRVLPVP